MKFGDNNMCVNVFDCNILTLRANAWKTENSTYMIRVDLMFFSVTKRWDQLVSMWSQEQGSAETNISHTAQKKKRYSNVKSLRARCARFKKNSCSNKVQKSSLHNGARQFEKFPWSVCPKHNHHGVPFCHTCALNNSRSSQLLHDDRYENHNTNQSSTNLSRISDAGTECLHSSHTLGKITGPCSRTESSNRLYVRLRCPID